MATNLRIAILYSEFAGYTSACLKSLKDKGNVELLVIRWPLAKNAPFDEESFNWIDHVYIKNRIDRSEIFQLVQEFQPQILYISGWMDRDYLRVAKKMKSKGIPVVAGLDSQYKNSWRQIFARIVAPVYLHPSIDVVWVPGERQRQFARKLGYSGKRCWGGLYACDWNHFSKIFKARDSSLKNSFLYIGRYIREKGLEDLVYAYKNYRESVRNPWDLLCSGSGELGYLLDDVPGVIDFGFNQPEKLLDLYNRASSFILPSRDEPWGVVLHEAAATGLPLICSDACGAGVHLLNDRDNGFVFGAGDVDHLSDCMIKMHTATEDYRCEMGRRSYCLSKQFTPRLWAETFISGLNELN